MNEDTLQNWMVNSHTDAAILQSRIDALIRSLLAHRAVAEAAREMLSSINLINTQAAQGLNRLRLQLSKLAEVERG